MHDSSHKSSLEVNDQGTLGNGRTSPGRVIVRGLLVSAADNADLARAQTADVHVCDVCGRPVTARDKNEYTAARARLVVERGLCVCPMQAPTRGPSLI